MTTLAGKLRLLIPLAGILITLTGAPLTAQVLQEKKKPQQPILKSVPPSAAGFERRAQIKPKQKYYFADCTTNVGDLYGMWLLDSLGDTVQHVSSRPGSASWSSDELRAVCVDPRRRLKILDLGKPRQGILISLPEGFAPEAPAWSPIEDRIAFTSIDSTKRNRVYLVDANAEGSDLALVTTGDYHYARPAWWPDGLTLLVSRSSLDGKQTALVNISMETGREEVVYQSDSLPLVNAVVSPDGKYIVAQNPKEGNLYRMNADGTELTNITKIGSPMTPFANANFSKSDPDWIICAAKRTPKGSIEIYRIPIQGGAFVQLTKSGDGMNFLYAAPNM